MTGLQSLLQEAGPHVLFLVDFGFCQMGDVGILSAGGQTKLHSWPHLLGPGSNLGGRGEGWGDGGSGERPGDAAGGMALPSQQPLEESTGRGVLATQRILGLCFLAQHPQACGSRSCLTPGEQEEEELLVERVSRTCSAKAQATDLENRSPWLTRPHLRPPTHVGPLHLSLQEAVHMEPDIRGKRTREQEFQLQRPGLRALAFSPPQWQKNLERVTLDRSLFYFQKVLKEISSSV